MWDPEGWGRRGGAHPILREGWRTYNSPRLLFIGGFFADRRTRSCRRGPDLSAICFLLDAGRKGRYPGSPCAVCPEHANHKPRHGSADFGLHTYAHTLCTLAAGIRCYTNNNNDMRMLPNSASVAIDCPSTHQVQFCSAARVCKTAQDALV